MEHIIRLPVKREREIQVYETSTQSYSNRSIADQSRQRERNKYRRHALNHRATEVWGKRDQSRHGERYTRHALNNRSK